MQDLGKSSRMLTFPPRNQPQENESSVVMGRGGEGQTGGAGIKTERGIAGSFLSSGYSIFGGVWHCGQIQNLDPLVVGSLCA